MDTMVDYTNSILNSFRSNVYDAIMIYGFTVGKADTGTVKAKLVKLRLKKTCLRY